MVKINISIDMNTDIYVVVSIRLDSVDIPVDICNATNDYGNSSIHIHKLNFWSDYMLAKILR